MPATYAPGPRCNGADDNEGDLGLSSPKHKIFGVHGHPATTCWWITCGYLCWWSGQRLGKRCGKPGISGLMSGFEKGQAEGLCGNLGRPVFGGLDALGRGTDPGGHLLALGIGVLKHGQRPLELVVEDSLQRVEVALDVDH